MTVTSGWREVESRVYYPASWLALSVGGLFTAIGLLGCVMAPSIQPPGAGVWLLRTGALVFALLGGTVLALAIDRCLRPRYIRHAAADVLPRVPSAPVLQEGSVVHLRQPYELTESADGWHYGGRTNLWRQDKVFLYGFGIPFSVIFAALLSWAWHRELNAGGWPLAIVGAVVVTTVCDGLRRFGVLASRHDDARQSSPAVQPGHCP